jgi:hypothetical protein
MHEINQVCMIMMALLHMCSHATCMRSHRHGDKVITDVGRLLSFDLGNWLGLGTGIYNIRAKY